MVEKISVEVGGKVIEFEVGRLAKQAGGAVLATCGDTQVLATSTMGDEPQEPADFFPLTVDYLKRCMPQAKFLEGSTKGKGVQLMKKSLALDS